jgi:hypothetical protein
MILSSDREILSMGSLSNRRGAPSALVFNQNQESRVFSQDAAQSIS